MPPKKPPKRLTFLALEKVGEYLLNFCDGVSYKSYGMITMVESMNSSSTEEDWNAPDMRHQRSFIQERERVAFNFVDEKIYWLQEQFFSSIPWYCHQSLVEHILKVLSKATQNAKTVFRKTAGNISKLLPNFTNYDRGNKYLQVLKSFKKYVKKTFWDW